jgi:GNAT superfamily N-acetyltransferase
MTDISSITYRPVTTDDLEAIATLYTHHWCNLVPDPADKMLAARLCVLGPLLRSPLAIVAEQDGAVVGVCMGGLMVNGKAPVDPRWQQAFDETYALAVERAKTANKALEGQLFGDLRELETADAFIATGDPYAEAELNLLVVNPADQGKGIGSRLFEAAVMNFCEHGAHGFFTMISDVPNFDFVEHRGLDLIQKKEGPSRKSDKGSIYLYGRRL